MSEIEALKAKITDLEAQLNTTRHMLEIADSQKEKTLKNEISEAIKLDYVDFMNSKDEPYSEDLCEAYKFTISRTFKILKRLGCIIE